MYKIKIEIEIPDEIYYQLKLLCKKSNIKINNKAKEILISAVESSEVINF